MTTCRQTLPSHCLAGVTREKGLQPVCINEFFVHREAYGHWNSDYSELPRRIGGGDRVRHSPRCNVRDNRS